MEARQAFWLYKKTISSLDFLEIVYAPIFRAVTLFELVKQDSDNFDWEAFSAVSREPGEGEACSGYPAKRKINKLATFNDDKFLEEVVNGFARAGAKYERLEPLGRVERVSDKLSKRQEKEMLAFCGVMESLSGKNLREGVKRAFMTLNTALPYYLKVLKERGVDAVAFRCYYAIGNFPIILACRMLGITVVDIQHGINGIEHPAYSQVESRESSSPFFPDVFWVWGDLSRKALLYNSCIGDVASTVCGGNPILHRNEVPPMESRNKVLYTHQPASKGLPLVVEELFRAAQLSKRPLTFRPHPLHMSEGLDAIEYLQRQGIRCELEDPRNISIIESLKTTRFHITHSSTCALDALNHGIPTLYRSDYIGNMRRFIPDGLLWKLCEMGDHLPEMGLSINYSVGSLTMIDAGVREVMGLWMPRREVVVSRDEKVKRLNEKSESYIRGIEENDLRSRIDAISYRLPSCGVSLVARALKHDGIALLPDSLSREHVDSLNGDVSEFIDFCRRFRRSDADVFEDDRLLAQKGTRKLAGYQALSGYGKSVLQLRTGDDEGMIDVFNVDKLLPRFAEVLRPFFEGECLSVINEAFGGGYAASNMNLYLNDGVSSTRGFHVDSYAKQIKAFVYLSDVERLEDGPYVYVKGSHIDEAVRRKNVALASGLTKKTEAPVVKLNAIVPGLASKGALIISDQSGIHRGFPQQANSRRCVAVMNYVNYREA